MSEVKTNKISSLASNNDITLDPDGTGNTIIASGEVGVGTTTPATYTDYVSGSNAPSVVVAGSQPSYVLADTDISGNDGTLGITKAGEDTVINNLGAGNVRISNNGSERMRIDSSGNFGIGTSSPAVALHVQAGSGQFRLHEGNAADNKYGEIEVSNGKLILHSDKGDVESNTTMQFHLDNSEKMRIDHLGRVFFFCTDEPSSSVDGAAFINNEGELRFGNSTTGNTTRVRFYNPNGEVGAIRTNGSNTSYITSSDYRLKENVVDMSGAIDRVKALAPKRFNFIADADTTVDGFLAHEAQTVVPEAISGTKHAVDEDGNIVVQGIDQSKLVPLLTGALQEAIAKIESLETKVAALEAGE